MEQGPALQWRSGFFPAGAIRLLWLCPPGTLAAKPQREVRPALVLWPLLRKQSWLQGCLWIFPKTCFGFSLSPRATLSHLHSNLFKEQIIFPIKIPALPR